MDFWIPKVASKESKYPLYPLDSLDTEDRNPNNLKNPKKFGAIIKDPKKGVWKNAILADEIFLHPEYNKPDPFDNDIAIIKVSDPEDVKTFHST